MNKDSLPINPLPVALEHSVRLLYPFWIEAGRLDKAVKVLSQQHLAGRKREFKTWQEPKRIPDLYREEILPLVANVLFGIRSGANRYLRLDPETLSHWFPKDGLFEPAEGAEKSAYPLVPAGEGIELFLTPHGVGLLSLTFDCPKPGGLKDLQAFNYRLSQLREYTAWQYRIPHDPNSPYPAPDAEAPLEQRLGNGGGAFVFKDLVEFLLSPLKDLDLQEVQQQFSVYSVSRFDKQALFTDASCQETLRPFLAALTHVEEATHQGSLGLQEQILNPRHWTAAGSLGAAHLVSDQDPPHPFDQQRLPRSLYKYFVPYLCATLQRLTLQKLLWDTDSAVLETEDSLTERQKKLRGLHQDMLRFSVQGCFTEISSREVYNQYYELALRGLRVEQSLQLLQRVLHDLEAAATAAFQQKTVQDTQKLARRVGTNVGLLADVQRKVEWLEVFFVSYYATALVHYVGEGLFSETYLHWSAMLAPFVSGIIALLFIRPYASHEAQGQATEAGGKPAKQRGSKIFLALLALLTATWMAAGYHCFPSEKRAIEGASFLCASGITCEPEATDGTI